MSEKVNVTERIENRFRIIRVAVAVGIALLITFIIISFLSRNPLNTFSNFIFGPFRTLPRIGNIIERMTPLLFTGVGVAIMYSGNQINMSSEGAFFLGGVAAAFIAVSIGLPLGIHPVVCLLVGGIVGSIVTTIPALMFVKFKALPVVSSLMINYVCLFLGLYVINYIIRDPQAGYLASYVYPDSSKLPKIIPGTNVHLGLIIALAVVIFGYLFLFRSKRGYEIRMLWKNSEFSRYSGIKISATVILCQVIGGFLAGLGGAVEQLGMYNRFQYQALPGLGFDGIMIAILARFNPKNIPLSAFFLAYVRVGADILSRTSDVPVEIVSIIQAIIIIFVAAEQFLSGWKHKKIVEASQKALALEGGK